MLVLAFAGVAWRGLPGPLMPQPGEWGRALQWTVGFAVAGFIALSIPGRATPKASAAEEQVQRRCPPNAAALESYLKGLSAREKQQVANALALYRRTRRCRPCSRAPPRWPGGRAREDRRVDGHQVPPLQDAGGGHGRDAQARPRGEAAIEARQYPLDGGCNPTISPERTDGGLRCLAGKAKICRESAPDYGNCARSSSRPRRRSPSTT